MTRLVNIVTCAAYVGAGWGVVVTLPTTESYVMGFSLVVLAVGSAIYHALEWSIRAHRIDQAAMYLTFTALVAYAVLEDPFTWAVMLFGGIAVAWMLAFGPDREIIARLTILQPVMIIFGSLTTMVVILEGRWAYAPIALSLFGVAWWAWHRPGWWGHGAWHVLTAAAILLLFLGVR